MTDSTIAFIGAGNIARAIIGGLLAGGYDPSAIRAADPDESQRAALPAGVGAFASADEAVEGTDAIIVCVKPGLVADIVASLATGLDRKLVMSVAAGITVATIGEHLAADAPIVRCMPNTPALVGTGMTGMYASSTVTEKQRELADRIMRAVGRTLWFDRESDLDAVTAVSGSGPAYFFLVMEAMEAAGTRLGLEPRAARTLVLQTALGAATMASQSTDDPGTLRRNVTSPGGTTQAAINELVDGNIETLFDRALGAAHRRSIELAGPADNGESGTGKD